MTLSKKLLELLVCPKCKGKLDYKDQDQNLICNSCRLKYKVEDNIPILLIEEAESF
jgi:uncharacterized protein YbaR (Trm112 family)